MKRELEKIIIKVESDVLTYAEKELLKQALEELETIKSADGGEILEELNNIYNKPFDILRLDNAPLSAVPQFANFAKRVYNYLLKSQAQEQELRELKKSDESKEQSSIDYYNEMRKYKRELEELKKRDTAMKPAEAMITWQCGKCGKEIRNTFNSCPYCRTRIDWSGIYGSGKDE